ncbi:MAG TPA: CBS domain-containing protein [Ktedonobacteraceae bacterium]|nr:CBS domain-containing protein [Ktedonobacteraceae bacterium]
MIVSEVMTTDLVTVTPDDTLSHAANLLRQHQFHHLPVVKATQRLKILNRPETRASLPILEGLVSSGDIELAASLGAENTQANEERPWQERHVAEVMNRSIMQVTPTTSVAAAAQMLVNLGLNCLPVVEYEESFNIKPGEKQEERTYLVGLLTRSDLLIELARTLGAFEPGMNLHIPLHSGNPTPLSHMLLLATELHIKIESIIVAPPKKGVPHAALVRIGTINPAPLLVRLQQAGISYSIAEFQLERDIHG